MQSCCFGFGQHRGRWAVFSAAFHHAERAPRVTSSLTAESPTIRSFSTILGVEIRSLTTRVRRARKTRKCSFLWYCSCCSSEGGGKPITKYYQKVGSGDPSRKIQRLIYQ